MQGEGLSEKVYGFLYNCENIGNYGWSLTVILKNENWFPQHPPNLNFNPLEIGPTPLCHKNALKYFFSDNGFLKFKILQKAEIMSNQYAIFMFWYDGSKFI